MLKMVKLLCHSVPQSWLSTIVPDDPYSYRSAVQHSNNNGLMTPRERQILTPSLKLPYILDIITSFVFSDDTSSIVLLEITSHLVIPRIISGPIQLKHQSKIMLYMQCQFNTLTLPEVTVAVWERNNIPLSNSSLYNINI